MKKHLKELGFKKKWTSDHSGYWWEKKCLNPFLDNLTVNAEKISGKRWIYVDCKDPDDAGGSKGWTITIHQAKYSKRYLDHVLEYFDSAYSFVAFPEKEDLKQIEDTCCGIYKDDTQNT